MRIYKEEITKLTGRERERRGRALLSMQGKAEAQTLGGIHTTRFTRSKPLLETEIAVGDLVMVSRGNPLHRGNPTGTVAEKTKYSISVAFTSTPPPLVHGRMLRLDLFVNDVTFQRMLQALVVLATRDERLRRWRNILFGKEQLRFATTAGPIDLQMGPLNESQKLAVLNCLRAQDLFLVHGPPGTGKTTTLAEVVAQHVARGQKVLTTAASNIAVDNMVEFLAQGGLNVVRIGHPARVTPHLREHTLDGLIDQMAKYRQASSLREQVEHLNMRQARHLPAKPRWRRGMSDKTIQRLAKEKKGSHGVPAGKVLSMARWIRYQENIRQLLSKANWLEQEAVSELLNQADVISATNATAGNELLENRNFDVVVIDEATQATEPSCLIPLVKGKKLIMAGDHKQLPPTILSRQAQERGLATTLFERLLSVYGTGTDTMLTTQYRMNRTIMEFSNIHFYEGKLKAAEEVAEQCLDITPTEPIAISETIWSPNKPLVFINTNGTAPEHSRAGSKSRENPKEALLVQTIVRALLHLGLNSNAIGVITPYDDQVDLLRQRAATNGLEISTVDGFQGREKDVIIVSFVRSNDKGDIGFLQDLRRLNVSVTRARKKLIMIGDEDTLSHSPTYRGLIALAVENGGYTT